MLGCSKQNISYWALHTHSSQAKRSIIEVIHKASDFFGLDAGQAEDLANSAGLSLNAVSGSLTERLKYSGKPKDLCAAAGISERMLRNYKKTVPTKQALLAIVIALNFSISDMESILQAYGYCLSESLAEDVVVRWYVVNNHSQRNNGARLLNEINDILEKMALPLLMTRIK